MNASEAFPLIAPDARILLQPQVCRIETDDVALDIRAPRDPAAAGRALASMYGDTSAAELARDSGLGAADLAAICAALAQEAMVSDARPHADPAEPVDGEAFVALCARAFAGWKQRLFGHPLWVALAEGEASRPLFLGWLIENYHLIEAATVRLPVAIAACAHPVVKRHFVKHFREEFDHHHFFRQSLRAAGLDVATVEARPPLPGTMAVINHMRACARRDSLSYAACSGFLESTGEDHQRAREFFRRLGTHFDSGGGAIVTPLAEHAALDEDYGHCGMLALVVGAGGTVTRGQARRALADAHALVEALELWSTDILRHYDGSAALSGAARRYRPVRDPEAVA